jgi:hypothetical protein
MSIKTETQPSWLRPSLVPLPAPYFGWLLLILLLMTPSPRW